MRKQMKEFYGTNDTIVECRKCGRREHLMFANGLRNGWTICCGETMILIKTKANIEKSVEKVIDCQVPRSRKNTL